MSPFCLRIEKGKYWLLIIPIISALLLAVNFIFAVHNPYLEKDTTF